MSGGPEASTEAQEPEEEEFVLPDESTFAVTRWVRWLIAVVAPVFAAMLVWLIREIVQDRLAGKGYDNVWLFAFILATLAILLFLMLYGLAFIVRGRLTINHQGVILRGVFGARSIPWDRIEGFRWNRGQGLFLFPVEDRWPANLTYFENQDLLYMWLYHHTPNLHWAELAKEADEIQANHELGMTNEQKEARLAGLKRITRTINWIAYVAGAIGAVNALFFDDDRVQLVTASALVPVPIVLVLLALRFRDQVRLDYREGSFYPEGLTGILASGIALGLMSLLDHHNTLGDNFAQWTFALAALGALVWLGIEGQRIRTQRRWMLVGLHVLSIVFVSAFWAGGSVYQVNKNADVSEPAWDRTVVTRLRESREKTGTAYHAEVAPWSASAEPVELNLSSETYGTLRVGAAVEIGVRAGALQIPWVDQVRLKKQSS